MENSELIAILWHQGESDSHGGKYKDYLGKEAFGASCVEYEFINQELLKYAENNENCYFITGKDLYANPDGIHINAESQRRLGIRYFEAYHKKINVYEPLVNETELVNNLLKREHTVTEKRYMALEQFTLGKSTLEEVMKYLNFAKE